MTRHIPTTPATGRPRPHPSWIEPTTADRYVAEARRTWPIPDRPDEIDQNWRTFGLILALHETQQSD